MAKTMLRRVLLAAMALSTLGDPQTELPPTVMIALFARNKEHVLPYTLTLLDGLDYPKDRISLYVRCDHSKDRSRQVLRLWLDERGHEYHSVNVDLDNKEAAYEVDGARPNAWPEERFGHLMRLKQDALEEARDQWADFVWFLDADVLLRDESVLSEMVALSEDSVVSAPMLKSLGLYSNFWAGMTEEHYYLRTDKYLPILDRKELGCHEVPMVHSSFLINLRKADSAELSFEPGMSYEGPYDDIIVFALSSKQHNVSMHICNQRRFGYVMVPPGESESVTDDWESLVNLLLEATADSEPLVPDAIFKDHFLPLPKKDKLGVDKIYMINLKRRTDRREKMDFSMSWLGIEYEHFEAVDGKEMDFDYLRENGIEMMPDFSEPYHSRPLTYGEIGCFMSHYHIWQDMIDNDVERAIVFEDDIRFEPYFRSKLNQLYDEIERLELDWDLIFLGRKILHKSVEPWVEDSDLIVDVDYTYWTLSYMLSNRGARKLVDEEPLGKMVPVDEYLPIMYDRHPNETWKGWYKNRNLKAFSVHPLLVHPTHYTGEEGYISDTEDTAAIANQEESQISKEEL